MKLSSILGSRFTEGVDEDIHDGDGDAQHQARGVQTTVFRFAVSSGNISTSFDVETKLTEHVGNLDMLY